MSDLLHGLFEFCGELLFHCGDRWRLSTRFGVLFSILAVASLGLAILAFESGDARQALLSASSIAGLAAIACYLWGVIW
jgi:hypothetical protein